jgi:hypothetical protein
MELHDPIVVYTAGTNLAAHQLAEQLLAAGIESQVVEDNATMGVLDGTSQHSQVWISSSQLEQARAIAQVFEQESIRPAIGNQVAVELHAEWIDATCDKCGTVTRFAPIHKGTIVNCPNCFAFMDVGDDVDYDDWNVIDQEDVEGADSENESSEEAPE